MKKVTALVLAIAMVMSLATFQIFTTAEADGELYYLSLNADNNSDKTLTYDNTIFNFSHTGNYSWKNGETESSSNAEFTTKNGGKETFNRTLELNSGLKITFTAPGEGNVILYFSKGSSIYVTEGLNEKASKSIPSNKILEIPTKAATTYTIEKDSSNTNLAYIEWVPSGPSLSVSNSGMIFNISKGATPSSATFDVTVSGYTDTENTFFAVFDGDAVSSVTPSVNGSKDEFGNGTYTVTVTPASGLTKDSASTIYIGMGKNITTADAAKAIDHREIKITVNDGTATPEQRENAKNENQLFTRVLGLAGLAQLRNSNQGTSKSDSIILVFTDPGTGTRKAIGLNGDQWLFDVKELNDGNGDFVVVEDTSYRLEINQDKSLSLESKGVRGVLQLSGGKHYFSPVELISSSTPFTTKETDKNDVYIYANDEHFSVGYRNGNDYYYMSYVNGDYTLVKVPDNAEEKVPDPLVFDIYAFMPSDYAHAVRYHDYNGNVATTQYYSSDTFRPTAPNNITVDGTRYTLLGWTTDNTMSDCLLSDTDARKLANLYAYNKDKEPGKYNLTAAAEKYLKEIIANYDSLIGYDEDSKDGSNYRANDFEQYTITGGDSLDLYPIYVPGGYNNEVTAKGPGGTTLTVKNVSVNDTNPRWLGYITVEIYKDGELEPGNTTLYFQYNSDNMVDIVLTLTPEDGTDIKDIAYVINGAVAEQAGGSSDSINYSSNHLEPTGGALDNVIGGSTVKIYMSTRYTAEFYLDGEPLLENSLKNQEFSTTQSVDAFTKELDELRSKEFEGGKFIAQPEGGTFSHDGFGKGPSGFIGEAGTETYKLDHGVKALFGYLVKTYDHAFDIPAASTETEKNVEDLVNGDEWVLKGEKIGATTSYDVTTHLAKADDDGVFRFYAYTKGDLKVEKVVTGAGAGTSDVFTFTITFTAPEGTTLPASFTGADGSSINITGNKATFTLTARKSVTISGLPTGTKYTITESDAAGYTTDAATQTGEIKTGSSNSVTFTNNFSLSTGSLTIKKEVSGDVKDGTIFRFKITPGTGVYIGADHTVSNATYNSEGYYTATITYSVGGDNTVTLGDLPAGDYTVEELDNDLYTTTYSPNAGGTVTVTAGAKADVTVTNTLKTGSITIGKVVNGSGRKPDAGTTFTVEVTLKDGAGNPLSGSFGGKELDRDGKATFEIEDGKSVTLENVPYGTQYTVEETNSQGAEEISYTGAKEGTLTADTTVTVINTYDISYGNLSITKNVVGGEDLSVSDTFTFTVKPVNGTPMSDDVTATGGTVTKNTDSYTVTLVYSKSNTTVTLKNLPTGYYTVTEGSLGELYGEPVVTYDGTTGNANVTKDGTAKVNVKNTVQTGTLTVSKIVDGTGLPSDIATKPFSFTVTLELPWNVTGATVTYGGESKEAITKEDGTVSFTLTGGSSLTISGIPYGTHYTVKETLEGADEHYYSQSSTTSLGTVNTSNSAPTVTFTNTYSETATNTGRLTLKKVTQGNTDQTRFTFKVTFSYTGSDHKALFEAFALEQGVTLNGATEFTKTYEVEKNTEGVTIINVPVGTSYTVTEMTDGMTGNLKPSDIVAELTGAESGTVTNDYKNTGNVTASGEIDRDKDADTVTFYNRYLVDIVISKVIEGEGHDKPGDDEEFAFTVELSGIREEDLDKLEEIMSIDDANGTHTFAELIDDFKDDNKVTIYVSVNKPATIYQVPAGVSSYIITEDDSKGADKVEVRVGESGAYTVGDTTGKQTVHNSTAKVTFINTYEKTYGDLIIGKTVQGLGADTGKEFTFTVTLEGDDIDGQTFTYDGDKSGTITDGKLTVTLSAGQSITIHNLPHGTSYTVSETEDGDYTASVTGDAKGTIVGETKKTVTFTNTRNTGRLTIVKNVTGGENVCVKDTFTFTVESSVKFTGKVDDVEFTDGVATVEVPVDGDTGSVTLEGLPTGTYTVTEEDASPVYTTTGSGATAEVKEGVPATVTVTNEIGVGSLTVGKDVTANNSRAPAPDDAEFTVKVTFTLPEEITGFDAACGGEAKAVVNNTTLTFTLKHGESFKIENIPYGVGYTVSEDLADDQEGHYEVTYSNGLGRVIPNRGEINDGNPDPSITVHNKYFAMLENTGSIWVLKRVKGTFTDAPESYTFTVTFTQNGVDKTTFDAFLAGLGAGVSGSTYTFTLKDGENKVIFDVPVGVTYTLKEVFESTAVKPSVAVETDSNDVTTEILENVVTGTIDASRDQDGFTFNNNYLSTLTVTKEVDRSPYAEDTRDTFDFTVRFSGDELADAEIRYSIPGGASGTVGAGWSLTFQLKQGQTVTFTGVPAGTGYTVTEVSGTRGETVKVNGVEDGDASVSGIVDVDAKNNEITFTNVYTTLKTGTINITKSVTGTGRRPAADTLFELRITLKDADNNPLSGTFGGVSFNADGVGTYFIKAGETLRLVNVPQGTYYAVEEINSRDADKVDYSLNGSGQLIAEIGSITVTNTYTKTYGNLKISKNVDGGGAETDVDFTFTVTLTGDGISGKRFKYDGSKSGEIGSGDTVTLRHGQSITIHDLPDGTGYTVTETPNGKYDSPDRITGTVSGNETRTAAFTNIRKTGSLVIEKSLTGGAGVRIKETFTFIITPMNGTRMADEDVTGAVCHAGHYTATVTLDGTDTGRVTITGLPTGDYTVEEQTAGLGGLYETPAPVSVTVPEGSVTANVVNEIQTGSLSVTKVFELSEKLKGTGMEKSGWNEKTVTFTVTFTLPDHIREFTVTHGDNQKAAINGTTSSFTFTLDKDHYENYPITGIPYGVRYELTETAVGSDSDYYVDTYVNGGGTVSASASSIQVTCTNTYHLVAKGNGALIIRKDVVGETRQTDFTFEVSYGTTTNRVTVKNGGYELVEVPINTPYTVTEVFGSGETEPTKTLMLRGNDLEPGDKETGSRTFSGVINEEYDSDSVHYVNMYLADLTLTKKVDVAKYAQGPDANQKFILFIDFSDSTNYVGLAVTYSVNGGEVKSIDRPGTLELRLKAGDVVTFSGIPVGASHTITESAATRGESVEITSTNSADVIDNDGASTSGTIVSGGVDIVFTNRYTTPKTGSITVEKKVDGAGRRPEAGTRYTVTVELTDAAGRHLSGMFGGQEPDVNGVLTFELEDGESVELENVPYGTRYTVRETNSRNADDVTITGGEGVLESDTARVTVTNTFSTTYGDLEIGKEVSGLGGDTKKAFTFTVTLTDAGGNRLTQEYDYSGSRSGKVTNGELQVTLAHGEKITIHGLPNGTRYAIRETGDTNYTTTYSVNGAAAVEGSLVQGSIDTGTNQAKVLFTNTRKSGTLTIEKSLANGLQVDRTFTFTVRSSVSFTGRVRLSTGEYVTFTNGEARDVRIAVDGGSGSVTLEGLPTGTYTVTETDTGIYTPVYTGSGVIGAGGSAKITVTNTIATGSLTVTKKVTSNNLDPSAQAPADAKFQIKVTFTLPADIERFTATVNGTAATLKNGESLTLTLGNGDTQTVTGIPYGVHYEVSEAFDTNYEVSYSGGVSSGTVSASNTTPSVTVNNKYFALDVGTGALWIFKEVQGSSPAMPRSYTFRVEFEQGTANADDYQAFLEDLGISGTEPYVFTLRANERKIIMGIPEGARYTVSEVFGSTAVKPANVVVTASECENATVANGTAGSDGTLSTPTAKGVIDASREVDGFTFYNQYLANLTLELIVDPSVPDGTEFEFTLKFSGLQAQQVSSIMKIDDANGTRESARLLEDFIPDDEVTITLRKGSTASGGSALIATIYNVPMGVSHYVFTATGDNLGDIVTWDVSTDRVEEPLHSGTDTGSQTFSEERDYVTFRNAYNGGWLTVEKVVSGRKPSVDEEYTFTVTPVGGTEPVKTFTVTGEGTKTFPLPAGEYTVTETTWGGSKSTTVKVGTDSAVTGKSANVTVTRNGEAKVTFTNTYENGGNVVPPLDQNHFSYIVGYPDGTVRPNGSITRAEVVSILYRILTDSARDTYRATTNTFDDVNEGAWYNLAVSTLQNMGAVSGYGDGTFRPDQPITRAEMAALIGQFYHVHKYDVQGHYDDVPEDQWFTTFVDFVTDQCIMVGVGGGSFEPYRNLTRAEAMAVFNRILGRAPDKFSFDDVVNDPDYVTWPDNANPDVWYYADVQEATNSHDYRTRGDNKELWTDARGMKHWEG